MALAVAKVAAAADVEALKAATVKITVAHASGSSRGSGIILCQLGTRVDILTAKHVLTGQGLFDESGVPFGERFRDLRATEIAFYRNRLLPVRFLPADPRVLVQKATFKDLALITLEGIEARLTVARLGASSALATGDEIQAVGHLDVDWDGTTGSVRSTGEFLRHSAAIDGGYSGGPVANAAGEVVGVNIQTLRGVARAVPIEEAMRTVRPWIPPSCLSTEPASVGYPCAGSIIFRSGAKLREVRSHPSLNVSSRTTIAEGTAVTILAETTSDGLWYQIEDGSDDGRTKWIPARYVEASPHCPEKESTRR